MKYSKNLSKYLSIVAPVLLTNNVANAEIIYVDVNPDHSVAQFHNTKVNEFYDIIIDGDSIMRIGNFHSYFTYTSVSSFGAWNALWVEGKNPSSSGNNAVAGDYFFDAPYGTANDAYTVLDFSYGNIINGSLNFESWAWVGLFSSGSTSSGPWGAGSVGNFGNTIDKYAATKFTINGNTHYGWLRFDVGLGISTFSFKDYAYENCPGAPIKAGQMTGGAGMGDTVQLSGCDLVSFNGKSYTNSGIIYDTTAGVSNFGCDSLTPLDILINKSTTFYNLDTIQEGDSILLGGNYQNTEGTYYDTLSTLKGCDSIIETSLSVIFDVRISEIKTLNINVFPNPSNNEFNIDLSKVEGNNIKYTLIDKVGKTVESGNVLKHNNLKLDIINSGIYFLKIEAENKSEILKLVKE